MKLKFLMNKKFSNDGINIIKGKKGELYEVNDKIASSFIKAGFAKNPLNPLSKPKAEGGDLENKAIEGTEENKEEKLKKKLETMKREALLKYAKDKYSLVLDKNLTNKKLIKKILEQEKEDK
jgi:hypothetical protein